MKLDLFTKEEIEDRGFIYEPDDTKCTKILTKAVYSHFSIKDDRQEWVTSLAKNSEDLTEGQWRTYISSCINCKYVNSIYITLEEPLVIKNKDIHQENVRVCVLGHTKFNKEELEERQNLYSELFDL